MEEKLDNLICALNVIKNHCEKHDKCADGCELFDEYENQCRVVGESEECPCNWDIPKVKERKEIVF